MAFWQAAERFAGLPAGWYALCCVLQHTQACVLTAACSACAEPGIAQPAWKVWALCWVACRRAVGMAQVECTSSVQAAGYLRTRA